MVKIHLYGHPTYLCNSIISNSKQIIINKIQYDFEGFLPSYSTLNYSFFTSELNSPFYIPYLNDSIDCKLSVRVLSVIGINSTGFIFASIE